MDDKLLSLQPHLTDARNARPPRLQVCRPTLVNDHTKDRATTLTNVSSVDTNLNTSLDYFL